MLFVVQYISVGRFALDEYVIAGVQLAGGDLAIRIRYATEHFVARGLVLYDNLGSGQRTSVISRLGYDHLCAGPRSKVRLLKLVSRRYSLYDAAQANRLNGAVIIAFQHSSASVFGHRPAVRRFRFKLQLERLHIAACKHVKVLIQSDVGDIGHSGDIAVCANRSGYEFALACALALYCDAQVSYLYQVGSHLVRTEQISLAAAIGFSCLLNAGIVAVQPVDFDRAAKRVLGIVVVLPSFHAQVVVQLYQIFRTLCHLRPHILTRVSLERLSLVIPYRHLHRPEHRLDRICHQEFFTRPEDLDILFVYGRV